MLNPRMCGSLIQARLHNIFGALDSPKILHICGDTNLIIEQMADCGADAISVGQKNNLGESQKKLGDEVTLLGNLDPYNVSVTGLPKENTQALMESVCSHGKRSHVAIRAEYRKCSESHGDEGSKAPSDRAHWNWQGEDDRGSRPRLARRGARRQSGVHLLHGPHSSDVE